MKNIEALKKEAAGIFAVNPDEKKLLATADGQFFLEKNRNAAEFHARKQGGKVPLTIHEIEADEVQEKKEVTPKLSAEERIAKINEMQTIEEVEAALIDEKAKTVKTAGEERIAALTK